MIRRFFNNLGGRLTAAYQVVHFLSGQRWHQGWDLHFLTIEVNSDTDLGSHTAIGHLQRAEVPITLHSTIRPRAIVRCRWSRTSRRGFLR